MGRLIDANSVYNAIQITTDNFGVAKHVVETNMLDMLAKIPTVEAIPKAYYEARLKADKVVMLEEIDLEFEELTMNTCEFDVSLGYRNIIEQKINELRGDKNEV